MEVVFGDGQKLWTGDAGSGPLDLDAQQKADKWQIGGSGPGTTDFYRFLTAAQGTMGIATWISLRCHELPVIHKLYMVHSDKLADLQGFVYEILKLRFGDELSLMNGTYLASLIGDSPERIVALRKELPMWTALIGIAGYSILPEERVDQQEKDIGDMTRQHGLNLTSSLAGIPGGDILKKMINPSGAPYWKQCYKGGFEDIFFVSTLDRAQSFIDTMHSAAEGNAWPVSDIGVYIQPQHHGTSCHIEFNLPYSPECPNEVKDMKDLFKNASVQLLKNGAFYSRPYDVWSELAYSRDEQTVAFLRKLKKIFDPDNIMNPAKLCF